MDKKEKKQFTISTRLSEQVYMRLSDFYEERYKNNLEASFKRPKLSKMLTDMLLFAMDNMAKHDNIEPLTQERMNELCPK